MSEESGPWLGRTSSTWRWITSTGVSWFLWRRKTFRTAPRPYYQLVTIHALLRGVVIPVCFCLLSGKTVGHYRKLLSHVSRKVRRITRRVWNPQTIICDFELSLITAIQTELPVSRVRGCYFHYTQSLWRKVSSLGLVTAYRNGSRRGGQFRKIIQKVMAIDFLPSLLISRTFQVCWHVSIGSLYLFRPINVILTVIRPPLVKYREGRLMLCWCFYYLYFICIRLAFGEPVHLRSMLTHRDLDWVPRRTRSGHPFP